VGNKLDPPFAALGGRSENFLSTIALTVRTVFNLPPDYVLHSDTTSHVLYGDYESSEDASDPSLVRPTYGYSKDKRDDLKQWNITSVYLRCLC
jgi:transposase